MQRAPPSSRAPGRWRIRRLRPGEDGSDGSRSARPAARWPPRCLAAAGSLGGAGWRTTTRAAWPRRNLTRPGGRGSAPARATRPAPGPDRARRGRAGARGRSRAAARRDRPARRRRRACRPAASRTRLGTRRASRVWQPIRQAVPATPRGHGRRRWALCRAAPEPARRPRCPWAECCRAIRRADLRVGRAAALSGGWPEIGDAHGLHSPGDGCVAGANPVRLFSLLTR